MAERKTRWTDADLKREDGPTTEYGPWTQTNAGKARYDEIIGEPTSIDEILAGARRVLREPSFANTMAAGETAAASRRPEVAARVAANPMPSGQDALRALLMVPGLIPGPVGVGSQLASAGLAASEGNLGSAGASAAMAMLPYGMGRAAGKARQATQEGRKVAEGLYRQTGISRGSEVPYRMGGSVQPRPASMHWTDDVPAYSVVDDAPVQQAAPVADELNDLMRAGRAPLRRETTRQQAAGGPSNLTRSRGMKDIEAEMRTAGASEKDIRQLYHSSGMQGKGVRVEGTGKKLSAEEKRIRQLLASMGME